MKRIIRHFQETYDVTVYLEPGEAVVLNAGFLVSEVLEIVHNGIDIAILDTSAAAICPMFWSALSSAGSKFRNDGEKSYTIDWLDDLSGGDIIGDYSLMNP
ncbi:MAG: hypothetical protein ACLSFZ_00430 [Frisingicoccus sp.]